MAASPNIARALERLGIPARRSGKEWVARCPDPDHEDRNPSWRIRDEPGTDRHGLHNCWSCGYSGSLTTLVVEVLGVDARGAREWLFDGTAPARDAAPPPPSVRVEVARARGFRFPVGVEFAPIDEWPAPARRYVERRGIPRWQVERWGLGFAVEGRLAGRVVVPYFSAAGRPGGYTARTYAGHPKRYIEADRKEGADRAAMFGERWWPAGGRWRAFVTEGALNALAVERAMVASSSGDEPSTSGDGWPCVAAIAGSSFRPAHAAKLATFAELLVLTDPDEAGDRVAGEIAAGVGRHSLVVRVTLPRGKDAADLAAEDLAARIDAAIPPTED